MLSHSSFQCNLWSEALGLVGVVFYVCDTGIQPPEGVSPWLCKTGSREEARPIAHIHKTKYKDVVGRVIWQCQHLHSIVLAAKWVGAERSSDLLRWSALSSLSRPQQTAARSGAEGEQWPLIYVHTPPSSTCLFDLFLHTAFKVISTVSPWMPQTYKSEENRPVISVNNAWDQLSLKTKWFWRRPSHAYGWGWDRSTNLLGSP